MDDEEEEPDLKQVQVPAGKKGVNNHFWTITHEIVTMGNNVCIVAA